MDASRTESWRTFEIGQTPIAIVPQCPLDNSNCALDSASNVAPE